MKYSYFPIQPSTVHWTLLPSEAGPWTPAAAAGWKLISSAQLHSSEHWIYHNQHWADGQSWQTLFHTIQIWPQHNQTRSTLGILTTTTTLLTFPTIHNKHCLVYYALFDKKYKIRQHILWLGFILSSFSKNASNVNFTPVLNKYGNFLLNILLKLLLKDKTVQIIKHKLEF